MFFVCNKCGETLKKNQIEKHKLRCWSDCFSCVDCGKDFWGMDYMQHTKCMTENEKYCGPGYIEKVKKGEVKQEQWIEKVQRAIEQSSSNPKLRSLLERLQDYPNIPRKKAKFENFLKNSLRIMSPVLISQVWDVLMAQANNSPETNQAKLQEKEPEKNPAVNGAENKSPDTIIQDEEKESHKLNKREKKEERQKKSKKEKKNHTNENAEENGISKKKKKRKHEDDDDDDENDQELDSKSKKRKVLNELKEEKRSKKKKIVEKEKDIVDCKTNENGRLNDTLVNEDETTSNGCGKFKMGATIKAVLEKKGEITLKKLKRKVLQEFASYDEAAYKEDKLLAKFDKKLNKLPGIEISDGRVRLKC